MTPETRPAPDAAGAATILIVDDVPQNLLLLGELLQPHFHVRAANSGERALRVAAASRGLTLSSWT